MRLLFPEEGTVFGPEGLILRGILKDDTLRAFVCSGVRDAACGGAGFSLVIAVGWANCWIVDVLRLGERDEDQVDDGGSSATKDSGRLSSGLVIGAVGIFESCFSRTLRRA